MKKKAPGLLCVLLVCSLIAGGILVPFKKAYAASAAMNLSLSRDEIWLEDAFSVVISVEASENVGSVDCFLSFDTEYLEFVSGGRFVTGGEGLVLISDDSDGETSERKYSMKFKAVNPGETTLWIGDDAVVTCSADNTEMSVSRNQLLFEIGDPNRISDDTELTSLTVSPGKLSPAFDPSARKYKASVGASTENIKVEAQAADPEAAVSISGNENLEEGKNNVLVTVTAPNGEKEVTTIVVTRKKEKTKEQIPEEENKEAEQIPETGVIAEEDEEGNRFLSETLRIEVLAVPDEAVIPPDYVKSTIVMNGLPIPVYEWKYGTNGDKFLLYGMNQDGESGLYEYSRTDNTLKKYREEEEKLPEKKNVLLESEEDKYKKELLTMGIAIGIMGLVSILLTVALVFSLIRRSTKKEEREDDFFL